VSAIYYPNILTQAKPAWVWRGSLYTGDELVLL
jgi:hypothetical protein